MTSADPLAEITKALNAWSSADDEMMRLGLVVQEAAKTGAAVEAVRQLSEQLSVARGKREYFYRATLAAMKARHDRISG